MEWNEFNEWNGMKWNRMEWNEMKLTLRLGEGKGMEWNGKKRIF